MAWKDYFGYERDRARLEKFVRAMWDNPQIERLLKQYLSIPEGDRTFTRRGDSVLSELNRLVDGTEGVVGDLPALISHHPKQFAQAVLNPSQYPEALLEELRQKHPGYDPSHRFGCAGAVLVFITALVTGAGRG